MYLMRMNFRNVHENTDFFDMVHIVLIAYYAAGFGTAVIHWFLDTYDFKRLKVQHTWFRGHHENPLSTDINSNLEHLTSSFIIFLSVSLANRYVKSPILYWGLFISNFAQISHKYCHRRNHDLKVPRFIQYLQDKKIMLHPDEHRIHHQNELEHYCILHSKCDILLEYMIQFINYGSSVYLTNGKTHRVLHRDEREQRLGKRRSLKEVSREQRVLLATCLSYGVRKMKSHKTK